MLTASIKLNDKYSALTKEKCNNNLKDTHHCKNGCHCHSEKSEKTHHCGGKCHHK